jgi:hypothetical protein
VSTPAPCTGKHALFDSTDERDHQLAVELCATCPLIDACETRLAEMLANVGYYGHPEGTWAGRLFRDSNGRNSVRRAAKEARSVRIAREDAAFTETEARQAHAAYTAGDRSGWAAMGHRVYGRRRKRRNRAELAAAS